jgi:hypothetical protein
MSTNSDVTAFLRTMIANPHDYRFEWRCYFGTFDGVEIRVVEATRKPPYVDHTINKGELLRLVEAQRKHGGECYVVPTKQNGTAVSEWCDAKIDAATLYAKLKDQPTRFGSAKEFWTKPLSFFSDREVPF